MPRIVLYTDALPQPRHRVEVRLPKARDMIEAFTEDPANIWRWLRRRVRARAYMPRGPHETIRDEIRLRWGLRPASGPVGVKIAIRLRRPKAKLWKRKATVREWDTRKGPPGGDVDNFAKLILDALNGFAYVDDSQVGELIVHKFTAAGGEHPKVTVEVYPLEIEP